VRDLVEQKAAAPRGRLRRADQLLRAVGQGHLLELAL
jgi:hypothetical protein